MKNNKNLRKWLDNFNLSHPLIIAGPCSAETENQVIEIADQLKDSDATVYRAGIWKPRTRPGNFEGVGSLALDWLKRVKKETNILTTTEVANANHVDLALKNDIDILWIGARTTVSPFIVQEIADALNGTDKIVLIKNPVNPDLSLWLGAIERIYTSNIKNIGAIHRGFSTYEKTKYRNNPEWQIAIDLQRKLPDLPLILDPSHIAGRRDLIFDLCQTALDLNYDGLMIETHNDPDNAWSDAKQQITPSVLKEISKKLVVRRKSNDNDDFKIKLGTLRAQINMHDEQLINILGNRMKVAKKIGSLKKENNVAVLQSGRWNEILERMIKVGSSEGLSEELILKVFKAIHRGFSTYEKTKYRNNPEWQIAIDLQRKLPDLPLILDPSHIAGRRDLIFDLCQTALDLNYDGLMIETHNDPDNAWSDAKQQITPSVLKEITKKLIVRRKSNDDDDFKTNLETLRAQINMHDEQLINVLGNRMKVAKKIGSLKKENNVAVLQSGRWNEILERMIKDGKSEGLSEELILKVFKAIHQESINNQNQILKK